MRSVEGSANCWGPLLLPCAPRPTSVLLTRRTGRAQSPARLPALWRFASVARRCSVRLGAEVTRMESDSDDVPLAQRVPKAAPKAAPAAAQGAVKRKTTSPSADARPKKPKPAPSKPRGESGGARAKKPALSADESSSGEDDDDGDEAKAGRSASRAAKKLEKDRKAVDEMSRIKKGVRLPCSIGPQTVACVACVTVRSRASLFKG